MLLSVHVVAGAAAGSLVGGATAQPILAFFVGWLSHYLLDSIPHWERLYRPHDNIGFETTESAKKWPRHIFFQAVVDSLVAIFLIGVLFWFSLDGAVSLAVVLGAIGAVVPDVLDNVPFWNRSLHRLKLFAIQNNFHQKVHVSEKVQQAVPKWYGLLTQLIIVGGGIWILLLGY